MRHLRQIGSQGQIHCDPRRDLGWRRRERIVVAIGVVDVREGTQRIVGPTEIETRPQIDGRFRQPTDVTWDTAGNIFISDGYVNSRVAKYDKYGDWVKKGYFKEGELGLEYAEQRNQLITGEAIMISFQNPPDLILYTGQRDSKKPGAAQPKGDITPGAVKYLNFQEKNGPFTS